MPSIESTSQDYDLSKTTLNLPDRIVKIYQQARDELIKKGENPRYLGPTTFFSELLTWAGAGNYADGRDGGSGGGKEPMKNLKIIPVFLNKLGLEPETQAKFRSIVALQIGIIEGILESIYTQREIDGSDEKNIEHRDKLAQAIFNQQLAVFFYKALSEENLPQSQSAIFISDLARSIGRLDMAGAQDFKTLINGARAQAGVCFALNKNRYQVILPDFNDEEEVERWDLNGVDLVAVSPGGKLLLIDVKGREMVEYDNGLIENSVVRVVKGSVSNQQAVVAGEVEEHLLASKRGDSELPMVSLVITVPTSDLHMGSLGGLTAELEKDLIGAIST